MGFLRGLARCCFSCCFRQRSESPPPSTSRSYSTETLESRHLAEELPDSPQLDVSSVETAPGHLQGEGDSVSGGELLVYQPHMLAIRSPTAESGCRPLVFTHRTEITHRVICDGFIYTYIAVVEDVIELVGHALVLLCLRLHQTVIVEEEEEVYDDDDYDYDDDDYDGGEKTEEELLGSIVFDL